MTPLEVAGETSTTDADSALPQDVSSASAPPRTMRADARRNYDKILTTARIVFAETGADSSLDEIARRAGVGPGTLYRHFPTRDALLDALMNDWANRVTADAQAVIDRNAPAHDALLDWFSHFVGHITLHRGAAGKICAAMDDPSSPIYRKCRVMGEANRRVIAHLDDRGDLRPGVDAQNVMRLVGGVATVLDTSRADGLDVIPMLEVVVEGLVRA